MDKETLADQEEVERAKEIEARRVFYANARSHGLKDIPQAIKQRS